MTEKTMVFSAFHKAVSTAIVKNAEMVEVPVSAIVGALELLKEQQEERNRMVSWLAKFCVHIDNFPDGIKKSYAEQYDFFKRKMNQQFGWEVD